VIRPPVGFRAALNGLLLADHWSSALGAPNGCWHSGELHPVTGQPAWRTLLWRTFGGFGGSPLAFGMMNPSTADHMETDPTVRKCIAYARREGASGLIVVNRSPWRATYQENLEAEHLAERDVLRTAENAVAWAVAAELASKLVLAWGTPKGTWPEKARGAHDAALLAPWAGRVFTIGPLAKSGEPKPPAVPARG
jgi:hypothetical protein